MWKDELRRAVRDADELCDILGLPEDIRVGARASARLFPLLVPRGFIARMRPGDPDDPLLRQVLPVLAEGDDVPGWGTDPVGESACAPQPGLLRKYHGRALLITTGACAVHCRYCFRRHFPYDERPGGARWWQPALAAIASDPSVEELILSGGDPLTLDDDRLSEIARAADRIPHLRRLRLHTRLPVVVPERVDAGLGDWLASSRLQVVVVIHANHANEVDESVRAACHRLGRMGVTLLNQSVLLRGVNDHPDALENLSQVLFKSGVMPYYLHLLDPVRGAAHFAIQDDQASRVMAGLAGRLPGYLVPRLVREVPGRTAKSPIPWELSGP